MFVCCHHHQGGAFSKNTNSKLSRRPNLQRVVCFTINPESCIKPKKKALRFNDSQKSFLVASYELLLLPRGPAGESEKVHQSATRWRRRSPRKMLASLAGMADGDDMMTLRRRTTFRRPAHVGACRDRTRRPDPPPPPHNCICVVSGD